MTTTLAQRVVSGLKERILAGDLTPGVKLPSEAELIEAYGVSRTVVREAVTRLRAEGLVETFQGRGSFVLAVPEPTSFQLEATAIRSHDDVLAMVDFRLGLESEAAALAAARVASRRHTGGEEVAISDTVAAFRTAENSVEADFAFHRAVAAASGNRFYVGLLDSLGPMMIMLPRARLGDAYTLTDASHVERVGQEHDNVAAAVLAGDPDTARAAMRVHLGNSKRRLTSD
jgi:GntR family transcriptional regulator, transcriptional repressor for pyruvate dehydrogenase complex